jgi:hypothetical protein
VPTRIAAIEICRKFRGLSVYGFVFYNGTKIAKPLMSFSISRRGAMRIKNEDTNRLVDPEGRYVNYFKLSYNSDVFVIDYYQFFPEGKDSQKHLHHSPKLRLITTPTDAKQLLHHLKSAINKYEEVHGNIQMEKNKKDK